MSEIADFCKCKRDAKLLSSVEWLDWRLASVEEVNPILTKIRKKGILYSSDTVRLLDGYVRSKSTAVKQYKSNMEDMLLIRDKRRPADGSFSEDIYSRVNWTSQGGEAAVLLSCDDKITEVICFVLHRIVHEKKHIGQRVEELNKLMESVHENFHNGKTVLHYTVDQPHNPNHGKYVAELLEGEFFQDGKDFIEAADIYERTALHFAAFHGNTELVKMLIQDCKMKADKTDINKENVVHFAVKGKQRYVLDYLYTLSEKSTMIVSPDAQGRTALHKAALQGDKDIIETLVGQSEGDLDFIRQPDLFGQTALLEAARGGHLEALRLLLQSGSRPLHERNSDGRTALHYAVQLSTQSEALMMATSLVEGCESDKERSMLLWASATGSGTAAEASPKSSPVRKYLKKQLKRTRVSSDDLLSTAIELRHEKMAWELVTRCADTERIAKFDSSREEKKYANNVIFQMDKIEKMPEQGRDRPAINDILGRKEFAEGLAELFLNPYVKSPITIGISGDWGIGKSSLMIQTEAILLKKAAQLAFPGLLATEQFPGCRKIEESSEGQRKCDELNEAMKKSSDFKKIRKQEKDCPLLQFLNSDYLEEHRDVYKSLAVMDRKEMMKCKGEEGDSPSNEYPLGKIPSILTVRYNAWHYQNESEAWAGLAVETTKAIEESMTTAQRVRCHCTYAWRNHRQAIWMELILPCLLALFLSGWLAWVLWKIFSKSNNNEFVQLTYGSIPITILLVIWTVMRQFLSIIKPVSAQIMGYFSKPDHTTKLGYQHQVISDIIFLKEEIGIKPSWIWKFIGRLCNLVNLYPDYSDKIKGTSVNKLPAPSEDSVRMIVFVDDLDRCEESVILKILSAVNLVLAACVIDVVLGMDEKMIAKAMKRQFPDSNDDREELKELTKKYLSKIVQLPLALPDTSEEETKRFLREQRGQAFRSWSQNAAAEVPQQASSEESDCDKKSKPGDVCLEICGNAEENSKNFLSKLSGKYKQFSMFKLWPQRDRRDKKVTVKKKKRVTVSLNFQRLMTSYSEEESQALDDLSEAATGERRLPREWKRFLIYHRVAWNILSQSETVKRTPGWQMQLVVWLFCCWQWEDQINDIIKDWKKLVLVNGFSEDGGDGLESTKPSLNYLIEYYRPPQEEDENGSAQETEGDNNANGIQTPHTPVTGSPRKTKKKQELSSKDENDSTQETEGDNNANGMQTPHTPVTATPRKTKKKQELSSETKKKQELGSETKKKQELGSKTKTGNQLEQKREPDQKNEMEMKKEKEKRKNWFSLKEMLDKERKGKHRYDVSLDCVVSFQKFRLHCDIAHLSSPKTAENKKE